MRIKSRQLTVLVLSAGLLGGAFVAGCVGTSCGFLRVQGHDIVDENGEKFLIRGTNLGNWLNPEGYMFGFKKCNSPHLIDEMFRELVGPDATRRFWRAFKDNYITEADIAFVAATGSTTVRLPFNYKLFTDEDYLDLTGPGDGFRRLDDVVGWCRRYGLRVILDMHDCPGGNTGDNIDDSYGDAWLFKDEVYERQYCEIWKRIAAHYADEPVVLGYDLMNEPISSRLKDMEALNRRLEEVQLHALEAIRTVDTRHIVILAGGQWNTNFSVFSKFDCDPNIVYECHYYAFGNPQYDDGAVKGFAAFRDKAGKPMYMGETGHNPSNDWYRRIRESMEANNIGWTFWPLKRMDRESWFNFPLPEGWRETVVAFAETNRSSYAAIQAARPDQAKARRLLDEYVENCKAENCRPDAGYLSALGLKTPRAEPPKVIFDTDMLTDFDDVGALACLHALADAGECEILATVSCTRGNASVGAVQVINSYYGRGDLPVGCAKGIGVLGAYLGAKEKVDPASPLGVKGDGDGGHYKYRKLLKDYPGDFTYADSDEAPDANRVYRKALAAAPDKSVVICSVGFITNLRRLLETQPDDISPLNGRDLVAKKVRKWVAMACRYPDGKEYNSMGDAESSRIAFENWPTPIVFSDWQYGSDVYAGRAIAEMEGPRNPVKDVFAGNIPSRAEIAGDPRKYADWCFGMGGRAAWDETAVLAAVRGEDSYFNVHRGTYKMVGADGADVWIPDEANGPHLRITEKMNKLDVARVIDELICRKPAARQ